MMNEDELISEMVNKAEALGYRKGFKQGLLRAAEICDEQKEEYENGQPISLRYTCAEAIRAEVEK
jgi:hypothetical protein